MRRRTVLALPALLAACAEPDDKAVYLTGVGLQGREAYVYSAVDQGWYDGDVEVQPGNGTNQNLTLLTGGRADYAVVDVTAALVEHGRGTSTGFTVVAGLQQRTLACLMALRDGPVTSLALDLAPG